MLKNSIAQPGVAILSRARQQAVVRVFQQARKRAAGIWVRKSVGWLCASVSLCQFVFFIGIAAAQTDPRAQKICSEANRIAQELNKISGLTLRHPVPCDFITK